MPSPVDTTLSLGQAAILPQLDPAKAKSAKIHEAAQQFEALMIGEMLKSARESGSGGWLGSGESTGDDSALGMAESQLSNSLAKSGGFGLASMIERNLTPASAPPQKVAETEYDNSPVSKVKAP